MLFLPNVSLQKLEALPPPLHRKDRQWRQTQWCIKDEPVAAKFGHMWATNGITCLGKMPSPNLGGPLPVMKFPWAASATSSYSVHPLALSATHVIKPIDYVQHKIQINTKHTIFIPFFKGHLLYVNMWRPWSWPPKFIGGCQRALDRDLYNWHCTWHKSCYPTSSVLHDSISLFELLSHLCLLRQVQRFILTSDPTWGWLVAKEKLTNRGQDKKEYHKI